MKTLSKRIEEFVKKAGLVDLVKEEATKLNGLYEAMDQAYDADDMEKWETLSNEMDALNKVIKNKIIKACPIKLEDVVLKNLVAYSIDGNI
ncbi:hypothetical protein C7967_11554 [Thalassospira sp. 11-3]|nr:hypothetical protein C7967_11554 [Thalassospira sp. 11-3]